MIKILQLQSKLLLIAFFLSLTGQSFYMQAQSVQRQGISSYGVTGIQGGTTLMQTVGQPYTTQAAYLDNTALLPGFQQPVVFRVENMDAISLKRIHLNVYPNPASFYITIQSEELIEMAFIRITDLQGKTILDRHVPHLQEHIIQCETWANGIYVMTVSDGKQILSSTKLIIKK
jgi:hypothetical protein